MLRRWLRRYGVLRPLRTKRQRERFLLPKEWQTIRPILTTKPDKIRVYFSILFLEGSRMSELRVAQWSHVDLDAELWHKTKTKNGTRQLIPLSTCSCDLLRQLPPHKGPYIFHGASSDRPWSRTAVRYWWRKIRWEAGCPDVQIRDIRRSTASWLTMAGENLKVVQEILDHRRLSTTEIYARMNLDTVRAALNRHAHRIFSVL